MPITIQGELRRVSQEEFRHIAFQAMPAVFDVHNELGRFLEHDIYRRAIAERRPVAQTCVPIKVAFDGFIKSYYLDLLVDHAAPFLIKAVEGLTGRHRAQLINYLLLMELNHGKLVNMNADSVTQEFVNALQARKQRTKFEVLDTAWQPRGGTDLRSWMIALVHDWGTGLEMHMYEEAVEHFYGGPEHVLGETMVHDGGRPLGTQPVRFVAPQTIVKLTGLPPQAWQPFEEHTRRFLSHTPLEAIQWINIYTGQVMFKTMRQKD